MSEALSFRLDAGVELPGAGVLHIGASVWLPREARAQIALVCLAGGNMNRRYYDLVAPDGDMSFSYAQAMTARGLVVIALDHLGLGDSSKPADGHALTPQLLTQANVNATGQLLQRLRNGTLADGVAAMPDLLSFGIGHSMGAMMTVLQQHAARQHAGIALLGFSTRGLPEYLPPAVKELTQEQQRAQLAHYAKKMFPEPYPVIKSRGGGGDIYGSAKVEPKGVQGLKSATDCLIPQGAFMSMLPNNVGPEAAGIDVPVFLGLGERDMAGPPHAIPAAFPKSFDVQLCILPEAGHSHFLFPARALLFERLAAWARMFGGGRA
ncbi:MAG TPA: alpha/beta fold hydrolase [Nevskiaceae bacterium]|nr:alpha/beta fold hydrolase [Nevskiaceae bacterium]